MSRSSNQAYLDRLEFIRERLRDFDLSPYDKPVRYWSRQLKSELTGEFNKAMLANATDEYADQHDYRTMAKLVRPFARVFSAREGYRLDEIDQWKPAQKAKLTRYYKKAVMQASRAHQLYFTTDEESMRDVAELSGQKGYPDFNRVFVAAPPRTHIHYNKKTKTLTATGERIRTTSYYWDQFGVTEEDLIADPAGVVTMVVAQLPQRKFSIKAGEYSIGKGVPQIYTQRPLTERVAQLVEKYGADSYDPDDPNSHYWGNWLMGIDAYEFETPQDEQDFVRATFDASQERRRYKRALRMRLQYHARKPK